MRENGASHGCEDQVHPQLYETLLAFGATALLAGYVGTRQERGQIHGLVLGLMLAVMAWTGTLAVAWAGHSPALSTSAALAAFAGLFFVPPLWLLLAAHVFGLRRLSDSTRGRLLVGLPSLLALVALATNESHRLFVRNPESLVDGAIEQWAGPLYWVWAGWGLALVMVGVGLYVARSIQLISRCERRRGVLLAVAALAPVLASLAHELGVATGGHDRTPLFVGAGVTLLFLADWRHRVLATVPVARRDVIEHLADGVIVTDASAEILDMNPAAEQMTGASLREVQGRHLADVVVEQADDRSDVDARAVHQLVERLISTGGKFATRFESFAGQVFEIRMAAVRPEEAGASGLYVIIREITKQTRFEALMRQSQRLETVAGLAAGIAHEVNNPLAYVRSNLSHVHRMTAELEVAASQKADRDELRLVIEEAIEGVDRIGRIIDRVRRFSRIGSEELAPASVNDIVRDAVRVARLSRFGSVELHVSLPDSVPSVEASAEALTQAVTNLVVNAAQSVAERGGSVSVSTRAVDDQVEICVADDGPGVPPDVRERMFDPFFTTKKTGEGTGLGLAVAFGIAREHGGVLLYDPPAAGGAVFLIRLPVAQGRASEQPASPPAGLSD